MNFDMGKAWDAVKEGTKEITETAHVKTKEFHKNYASKVIPDCGKYGDTARFVAEMAPGVSEYNAIVEGDWTEFAIAAGIDVGAFISGALTAGTGYAAVKGGSSIAKAGTKIAVKEVAEAGTKKAVKDIAGEGIEKVTKEVVEVSTQKAVKEVVKEAAEKTTRDSMETGAKKALKGVLEKSVEKVSKEAVELGSKKSAKEIVEKTAKETTEKVVTRGTKEIGERLDKKLFPEYLQEVEKITNREIKPNQMEKLQRALEEQEFVKLDPEKSKFHRKLFDNARENLIDEWEKNTGDKWPVYVQDVLNDAGEVIRKAGQRYDAHHLIESSFGGSNAWWNLHPAAFPSEHQAGIHAANSLANLIF